MLANTLALVLAFAAALPALATPLPLGPPPDCRPRCLPPPNPQATVTYAGDGTAFFPVTGDFQSVQRECRGMAAQPISAVNVQTRYPDGRPAYKLRFFEDYGCKGAVLAEVAEYAGPGPLTVPGRGVVAPKSLLFVPA